MTDTLAQAPKEEKRGSLLPVLRVIPEDCYERSTLKGLLYVARDVLLYIAVLAALVFASSWWLVIPLWALAGLAVVGLFVLGHDAAHGALFDSQRLNSLVGHIMFFPSMHVYEAWVLGHNRIHHGHTVRQGMDFVWHPVTAEQWGALGKYKRLQHRVEWSVLGAGAYYLREVWWHKMIRLTDPPKKWVDPIKRDSRILNAWIVFSLLGSFLLGLALGGGVVGGLWMVIKLIVVPFLLFNYFIGWAVYVHHIDPDVKWYKRREWTKWAGQMEGTTVLRTNWFLNIFFHKIFIHVPHHVDMRIPFYKLEQATEAIEDEFPDLIVDRKLTLRDYRAHTRVCKIYDFDEQVWISYAEADARVTASGTLNS
ncbi:MAG: fatty acid desaturase [Acidimicrobiales bacterium]